MIIYSSNESVRDLLGGLRGGGFPEDGGEPVSADIDIEVLVQPEAVGELADDLHELEGDGGEGRECKTGWLIGR